MKNYVKTFEQFVSAKLTKIFEANLPNKPTGDTIQTSEDLLHALVSDKDIKTLNVVKDSPYEKVIETQTGSSTPGLSFAERGGDLTYKGQPININDTNFVADSQEIEKKFQWIKAKTEKLTGKEFQDKIEAIKAEYAKRFPDSELTFNEELNTLTYSHRFKQNDNIAQDNYKTDDNKSVAKGSKIAPETKVVGLLAAKVEKGTTAPKVETTFIQLQCKVVTIEVPVTKEGSQKVQELAKKMREAGFAINGTGKFLVTSKSPMWLKKDDMDKIGLLNSEIETLWKVSDFLSPADPTLSKNFSKENQ